MSILLPGRQPPGKTDPFPIYARSGWLIPQSAEEQPALTIDEMRGWADFFRSRYRAIPRSLSLHPYNCVGMIFASRRALLDIDQIYTLLHEDGYREIQLEEVMIGDLVLYKYEGRPSHIGVIFTVDFIGNTPNIQVVSKWGHYPEFIHFIDRVADLLGSPTEFYTDRPNL